MMPILKTKENLFLLMSSETLKFLNKSKSSFSNMQYSIYGYNTYMGFKIALAEWLSLGEIDIK